MYACVEAVLGSAEETTVHVCGVHDAAVNLTGCHNAIGISESELALDDCTCTLRSAVSFCVSLGNETPCTVLLPVNSTLWLNETYGELIINNTSNIIFDGRESVIAPYTSAPIRSEESWAGDNCTLIFVEVRDSYGKHLLTRSPSD